MSALLLGGCSDDDGGDLPALGDSPGSATPTTAAPTTPAWEDATTRPTRPADEFSAEGAQAFTEFAAQTVFYVMATGDAERFNDVADVSVCTDCNYWLDKAASGDIQRLQVPDSPPTFTLAKEPVVTDKVFYQVRLSMDIPHGVEINTRTKKRRDLDAAKLPFKADVQWKDDAWVLMRYDFGN